MRCTLAALALLTPLTAAAAQDCAPPLKPMLRAELYFGRSVAGGQVSDTQWSQFARTELTRRFPDGLTILDARGEWRDGRRVVRERSKLVIAVMPDTPDAHQRIASAAETYKKRYRQKSVGIVTQTVCAAFD